MGLGLEIGKTGILTAQKAMLTAGNNIANANTPGFSKRTAIISAEVAIVDSGGFTIGQGVRLSDVRRETAEFLTIRLLDKQATFSGAEARNIRLTDLENLFNELGDFSLKNTISGFFDSVQELSKSPDSASVRAQLVEKADSMVQTFNQMGKDIDDMILRVKNDIKSTVDEANNLAEKIADLNKNIIQLNLTNVSASELEDQRDTLLTDLSKLMDTNVTISGDGITKNTKFGGRDLILADMAALLATEEDPVTGDISIIFKSDSVMAAPNGGALKGLMDFQTDANSFKAELDKLAAALAGEFNRIHSEGVNFNGSFSSAITGKTAVSDALASLDTVNLLPFEPSSGEIFVTVTDASGATVKTNVTVDVTTDSLTDLATKLDGVANLSASVVTVGSSSFLEITPTTTGFTFDFSSSLDPNPDLTSFTGASVNVDGTYTGSDNDTYTFTVLGSGGTIGSTAGLAVEVKDSGGVVLQTIDIGDDYVPGSEIDVIDGIKLVLSGGLVAGGDNFSIDVLNDPDETNIIASLGINAFFSGNTANTIAVDSSIKSDLSLIAAASSNNVGDNANALRMNDLEFKRISNIDTLNGRSFGEFISETSAQIGSKTNVSEITMATQGNALESLRTLKEQSVGVSIDEELTELLKYEQMFNASARFISVVNESIERILQI